MIKVEIGRCIRPYGYNDIFKEGTLYPIIPSRADGTATAFINSYQGIPIVHGKLIKYIGIFHHKYFEPVETIFLKNKKEVAKFKKEFFALNSEYRKERIVITPMLGAGVTEYELLLDAVDKRRVQAYFDSTVYEKYIRIFAENKDIPVGCILPNGRSSHDFQASTPPSNIPDIIQYTRIILDHKEGNLVAYLRK